MSRIAKHAVRCDTAVVAYDVDMVNRLREAVAGEPAVVEKAMFGGLTFMLAGHMAFRASDRGDLLVRLGTDQAAALALDPRARPFVMNGREIDGWLRVDIDATASNHELSRWIEPAVGYARSLPPK